jgi:hypothetical protein
MEIKSSQKNDPIFFCIFCDYNTSKKSNLIKHISTSKHKIATFGNLLETFGNQKVALDKQNLCVKCERIFASKSGLWKHKRKCSHMDQTQKILEVIKNDSEVHKFLMEQNKQLIEKITEQNKQLMEQNNHLIQVTNINNSNVVNNKISNKFNIQVFLNETCKNALNINDFINSLSIGQKELEKTARLGYAEGISQIFIDGLKQIDISIRPVHCSDYKRTILYIKDNNEWVKDNENKDKITSAIKKITYKNIQQIAEWQKSHPEYSNPESKVNDIYMKMLCEVMSGNSKEEQEKNYQRIIKNVLKEVTIDKKCIL